MGCLLAAAAVVGVLFAAVPVGGQPDRPSLLVMLVVDQMRADYLSVLERHWQSGLRTLLSQGAVFDRAEYPYSNTVTCAGHATVATGALPGVHGIVGNEWWDRGRRVLVDCVADPRPESAHVSYGRPAISGQSAHLLLAPTLGDELRSQRPGSRVVSLSLKPDSAVALAGHGGEIVTWFDAGADTFVTSRAFTDRSSQVLADFLSRDPFEKELGGRWALLLPPDAYLFSDATLGQRPPAGRDGLFPHAIGGPAGPDPRSTALWRQSPLSDAYLVRMAEAVADRLRLGRDDIPDVLAIGFSALDLVGHAHGPESREVEDVLVNLDRTIGKLLAVLDQQVGRHAYVVALTADHGVAATPQPSAGGRLIREAVKQRVEDTLQSHWGANAGGYVDAVVTSDIYFAPGVFDRVRADRSAWQAVRAALMNMPGISRVVASYELSTSSPDPVVRAVALNHFASRSGDVTLIPERNWIVLGRASANATTHGSWHDYDRRVPLILFGAGIKSGHFAQRATPADIAPTLANLIGLRLPRAGGRVLAEALRTATASAGLQ